MQKNNPHLHAERPGLRSQEKLRSFIKTIVSEHSFNEQATSIFRAKVNAMVANLEALRQTSLDWGAHLDWSWNGFVLSYAKLGGFSNWETRIGPIYETCYA
jgi:hypothetical protein